MTLAMARLAQLMLGSNGSSGSQFKRSLSEGDPPEFGATVFGSDFHLSADLEASEGSHLSCRLGLRVCGGRRSDG